MTGEEYLHLTDGDLCKLTEDIETNGLTWNKGDILEVVYRNRYEESIYVENKSVPFSNRPSYKELDALFFFKAMELYKKWNEIKKNTFVTRFGHRFAPEDTIWFMENNKPHFQTILRVVHSEFYKEGDRCTTIQYITHEGGVFFEDDEIYATKDELLDSLR